MATKTFEELKQQAEQIRDERRTGQNTATRIGSHFLDIINKIEETNNNTGDSHHKGYFETIDELKQQYPTPSEGDTAWVGTPYPGNVYNVVNGEWKDTGVPASEGGTSDYNLLENKPSINNVEIKGNKSLSDLGIQQTISNVNVNVDSNVGVPSATASFSGGTLNMTFKNLKGETGRKGETGDIGPRGEQGNSGVSGPTDNIEVVNNLNGGESTPEKIKVLSAEQGKVLKNKSSYSRSYKLKNLIKTNDIKDSIIFEAGSLSDSGEEINYDSVTRLRSDFIYCHEGDILFAGTDKNIYVQKYNQNLQVQTNYTWADEFKVLDDGIYRILYKNKTESVINNINEFTKDFIYINNSKYGNIENGCRYTYSNINEYLNLSPGNISSVGGQESSYKCNYRLKSVYLFFRRGDQIGHIDDNKTIDLYFYDSKLNFIDYKNINTNYTFEDDCICRFVNRYKNDSSFVSFDELISSLIVIKNNNTIFTSDLSNELLSNIYMDNNITFSHGDVSANGLNTVYKYKYRLKSNLIRCNIGDRIVFNKKSDIVYSLVFLDKTLKTIVVEDFSGWNDKNYVIKTDGYIYILIENKNSDNYTNDEDLISCVNYEKSTFNELYNIENWELGSINKDGTEFETGDRKRSKTIFKVKAGTLIVPYVFSRYMIAIYDTKGTFLKRLPEDILNEEGEYEEGGTKGDGFFTSNAYQFKEDAHIRLCLEFTTNASFLEENTVENVEKKFRIIQPNEELPYYIKDEINKKLLSISDIDSGDKFNITFITDQHEYSYHDKAAVYCASISSRYLISGGDWLSLPVKGREETWNAVQRHVDEFVKSTVPVLATKGNHEMSLTTGTDGYPTSIWFNQVQKPLMKDNYVYDGENFKKGYFFVDDDKYKVRIICLNLFAAEDVGIHYIGNEQRMWLHEKALNLSSKGEDEGNWTVIVFSHGHILDNIDADEPAVTEEERWVADVLRAAYLHQETVLESEWSEIKPDFTQSKFNLACYICGHSHYDKIDKSKDFPHISIDCAHPLENVDKYKRVFDSPSEYSFDVISFDLTLKKIKLTRIGVGNNREVDY